MFFVRPLKSKQIGLYVGTDLPLEDERKGQRQRDRERDEYEAKGCRERHHCDWRGNRKLTARKVPKLCFPVFLIKVEWRQGTALDSGKPEDRKRIYKITFLSNVPRYPKR